MNFFFDRCMSIRLARMAAALEADAHLIRHHDDDPRFTKHTKDTEWLAALAGDDPPWIVISGDGRILKRPAERGALSEANLTFFIMANAWCNTPIQEYVWKFFKAWPDIIRAAEQVKTPTIFEVAAGKALKVATKGASRLPRR